MTKKTKLGLLIFLITIAIIFVSLFLITYYSTSNIDLDIQKLDNFSSKIEIIDQNNEKLSFTTLNGKQSVNLSTLPNFVPQAFISIEDKEFYNHHGLNYSRIIKAGIKNIISGSPKEGASTITQQLIKNTHLSGEKTLKRKFQEAILAKKLEKKYSKEDILTTYLNVIYFGCGAYGIEEASNIYFNHPSNKLTLAESATLAGIIKSPRTYSPLLNPKKCLKRRNLVLKNMLNDGVISQEEYDSAISSPLNLSPQQCSHTTYFRLVIDEAMKVLNLSENDVSRLGLKIYTYLDKKLQQECDKLDFSPNGACVVIDNNSSGILAFSESAIINRQIGSLIKPILCYAPAFENGLLSPISQILDEEINLGEYSPRNVDKKYHGWVSVREALINSLNIPAIKALNYTGIDESKKFAQKLGLNFSENDNHLALALGASEFGENLLNITNAYSTFARLGKFCSPHFIHKIEDRFGKVLYNHNPKFQQQVSDATCFLINDILSDCVKEGTAQKLKNVSKNLCAKTGTVGDKDSFLNTDAWCVSYSPEFTVGMWIGNDTNEKQKNLAQNQNGGTIATKCSIPIWENLIQKQTITNFTPPPTVKKVKLDSLALQNQKIELASLSTPEKYIITDYFNEKYLPKDTSTNFTIPPISELKYKIDNEMLTLFWEGVDYLNYELYVKNKSHTDKICSLSGKNSTLSAQIPLPNEEIELYVISKFNLNPTFESKSNVVKFLPPTVDREKLILANWLNKKS